MSMYGTIYYQAAQGFAKFFLRNSGKGNKNFLQEDLEDGEVEATTRSSVFTLDSGNKWIQLEPTENGVTFYHSKPSDNVNELSMVYGMQKEDNPGNINTTELHSGDVIKVPLLYYDAAGHISPVKAGAVYYKMPTVDIEADISDLQESTASMQKTIADHTSEIASNRINISSNGSSIGTLQKNFGDIEKVTKDGVKDLCSAIGNLSQLQTTYFEENDKLSVCETIGMTKQQVVKLNEDYIEFLKTYNSDRTDLLERIRVLEGKNNE